VEKRIQTRVVDTGGSAKSILIQRDACDVCWIEISPETSGTAGLIQIYDGFSTGGKLVWQLEPAYSRHSNFIPPIPCNQGIFVYSDANIACYTIAYSPRSVSGEA